MSITKHFHFSTNWRKHLSNLTSVTTGLVRLIKPWVVKWTHDSASDGFSLQRKHPRAFISAAFAAGFTFLAPGLTSAQTINNPPQAPMEITVFPSRDFTSMEGFVPNADVLVQVRRGGNLVNDAVGRTDSTGQLEVNHPGGICWRTTTPDITAGDTVRVTYRNTPNNQALASPPVAGSGAATTTQNVIATQAYQTDGGDVVIKGKAILSNGTRIPLNRLEVRIVNPEFMGTPGSNITRREIRVDRTGARIDGVQDVSGTLVYDAATANSPAPTTFTATFRGLNQVERQLAVSGQTRAMAWQQTTTAGDRLGMTIYEVDEVGGPGMGNCPAGPGGVIAAAPPTQPVHYRPTELYNAADPGSQAMLKDVTVFPERDFISVEGFAPGTNLQIVVRRGTGNTPVVGTARGVVPRGGVFEVNHPGGVCWTGQTPNIIPGDFIDVFPVQGGNYSPGQTQRVIDTKVTRPAFITVNANGVSVIRVNGTATDNGQPVPLEFMEQRIINPDFANTRIGRRDIRADTEGGRVENVPNGVGNLLRTGVSPSTEWRAIYQGLNDTERRLAVAGQSRAMAWLSTNANGDRFGLTISEFGETGGPGMGGCPATGNASIAIP